MHENSKTSKAAPVVARVCNGISFTDADVVDLGDWIPDHLCESGNCPISTEAQRVRRAYNPHSVRPWLLHDHGFTLAVVFASNLQDALDAAADAGKLDSLQVSAEAIDRGDYGPDGERCACLGNASEFFDIANVSVVELDNPPLSFAAQYQQDLGKKD